MAQVPSALRDPNSEWNANETGVNILIARLSDIASGDDDLSSGGVNLASEGSAGGAADASAVRDADVRGADASEQQVS